MSLSSLSGILANMGISDLNFASLQQKRNALIEAMRKDLPLAVEYLHKKAHEADTAEGLIFWQEDPNSSLGKQLIRIFAGTVLRMIAQEVFCHGKQICFFNCCGGAVGDRELSEEEMLDRQIRSQNGEVARPDC